ncbi:MAG: hypothetical protein J5I65_14210 [Aridibacter famidurans]|nr:hypothetical protein [Aridibacter famidurans]
MIWPGWRVCALLLSILFLFSCVEDKDYGEANQLRPAEDSNRPANVNINANVAEDSEIKLSELVNIPFEPAQDSVWREDDLPEGAGKKLTVVFRFSKEDGDKLREQLSGEGTPFEAKVDPESWFPPELAARSSTTGDETLKGRGYNAASLAKEPYKSGTLVHIDETDYFVLTLQTK